ncbi:MAG: two-component sensor histidine kinase, partial [Ilumatobacter sp.]|nr:two-component sensor histidine kinase [Ilumatobacter sp.]
LAELVACIRARLRIGQHHAENLVPAPPRRLAEADGGRLELTAQHPATFTLSLLAVRR